MGDPNSHIKSYFSPISPTTPNKLQIIQNTAIRTITGCTLDANTQHLHTEAQILPPKQHFNSTKKLPTHYRGEAQMEKEESFSTYLKNSGTKRKKLTNAKMSISFQCRKLFKLEKHNK